LTYVGIVVEKGINRIGEIYSGVIVDYYVVMPNHVHMILIVNCDDFDGRMVSAPTKPISKIIGYFKQFVSRQIGFSPWQKSFHDHIIRDEETYIRIAKYIDNNPAQWETDCFYGVK
jgi:REP element-mobilizing transposase RayT